MVPIAVSSRLATSRLTSSNDRARPETSSSSDADLVQVICVQGQFQLTINFLHFPGFGPPPEPRGWNEGKQWVQFPLSTYWVTEKIAPQAEQAYRNNSTRKNQNAFVTVRVRNGDAALEQLYIDNQPLAEYLRAQPAKK